MIRVLGLLAIGLLATGCKKAMNNLEKQTAETGGQYSGGGNPTVYGAQQAVRGAAVRTVTTAELHDLHLFMTQAKLASGRTPTSEQTWNALNQPDGNRKLVALIQDGTIVLVPNPGEEGLWAYGKDAPTMGGMVLTHNGVERVTADEFKTRFNN
jgi:hypothetical protein